MDKRQRQKFSPEVRARAVRMVIEHRGGHASHWAAIVSIAAKIGCTDARHVSTSHVESHNQKMRQHMRRFTRQTAGHSKKFANHCHALALYFAYYNFVKVNSSKRMSPAMAAGIETRLWDMKDIVEFMDARAPKPGPRGPIRAGKFQSETVPTAEAGCAAQTTMLRNGRFAGGGRVPARGGLLRDRHSRPSADIRH